jgi:RHS repeat-associated protein
LERVEDGVGTAIATYYYDPFGRRLWKEVSGVRTYFLYADEGLIGEYDNSGNEIKAYGYKPSSTWTTDPLFMKIGSQYYFYQNDHLGSPQKLTAVNGAVVCSAKYSSFGKEEVDLESVTNNLRFAGQYYDGETGLHYNWQRYYDPAIGRYLRADPIGLDSGITLYAYAQNNPLIKIDPLGLRVLASCGYASGGQVYGGGLLYCKLEQIECYHGYRETADYFGIFGGITFGYIPVGGSSFTMSFNVGAVDELAGKASIVTGTLAVGGGASIGEVCIGKGCSSGIGPSRGVDISIDIFAGVGTVKNKKKVCCDD